QRFATLLTIPRRPSNSRRSRDDRSPRGQLMSSFGESLRRERELRQISLREISEATKINLRYLDALERDDFRHLPGGVFNKGFVRAYAQFIGIDPETMVTAYREEDGRQQSRAARAGAPPPQVHVAEAPAPSSSNGRLWL